MRTGLLGAAVCLILGLAGGQMPDPSGQVKAGKKAVHEAYLFAHMNGRGLWVAVLQCECGWAVLDASERRQTGL